MSTTTKLAVNRPTTGVAFDGSEESFEKVPFVTAWLTKMDYCWLLLLGYVNQVMFATEKNRDGYVPLYDVLVRFNLRVYRRIRDIFNRPVCSVPGAEVILKDRVSHDSNGTFEFTGTKTKCINLVSYNYLGFAENSGACVDSSIQAVRDHGLAMASSRRELGTNPLHVELEAITARFFGVEDAIAFGMGFATNSLNLPSLLSPGCLVISDEKNHASIILGVRLSGAVVRVFKHNNMKSLEKKLQDAIFKGQPKTSEPWRKILIIVEGIYSMEGSIVKLPEVLALKKKYKAYVYLDEAHSVGALGPNGRGVLDYYGINPNEVDILMGTYTKSFASAGGYIAGSKKLINFLRANSHAQCYASTMASPVAQQIITSMKTIMGEDGTNLGRIKTRQLARNTRYFRRRLAQIGVITYGHVDSPVVPVLVYLFSKIGAVVRSLTKRNVAVTGACYPATPILGSRIRFCISAAHTKKQLDYALDVFDEESHKFGIKYSRKPRDPNPIKY